MTRYDAILLLIIVLLFALGGYFIYRESTDPILFPGDRDGVAESVGEPAMKEPGPTKAVIDQSPPPAGSAVDLSAASPELIQASFEDAIAGELGQLSALMETQLSNYIGSMQEQSSTQGEKLASASRIVQEALETYEEETRDSLTDLSDTLNLIDEMNSESDAITSSLDEARTGWDQLFDDVATIDEMSDNRLDEENFEFQAYTVGTAETLSEIARKLESTYALPESDLSYLLNRFNEIEYRFYDPGGRRTPYRVVASESLRVPVPRTASEIIGNFDIPEKLKSQVSTINRVATANASLRSNLSRQVEKLQLLEANINAVQSLSLSLAQLDLSNPESMSGETALSPQLQEAWREFEAAAAAYRAASGSEEEKLTKDRLKKAISNLLHQYEKAYLNISETPRDPVDFYLRFMEKYNPGQLLKGP
jgi:hypothetical protein